MFSVCKRESREFSCGDNGEREGGGTFMTP
jgi:hypothetical protein